VPVRAAGDESNPSVVSVAVAAVADVQRIIHVADQVGDESQCNACKRAVANQPIEGGGTVSKRLESASVSSDLSAPGPV
jgi:hypothetical protein